MDCKECKKWIAGFIAKDLDYKILKDFLAHIQSCPDCKEELTIQILITEGLLRLEEGSAFDLNEELQRRVEEAEHKLRIHKLVITIGVGVEMVIILAIAAVVLGVFL
ncbi:MAG: zf-HC2 domain-containing protein [Lachnospiraceae bacterium]|jgi:hypothetical protein|nr:zf-HC2 domain-containing protein [Lachnospiraceae bacterium]